jgi:hypothetical protein
MSFSFHSDTGSRILISDSAIIASEGKRLTIRSPGVAV